MAIKVENPNLGIYLLLSSIVPMMLLSVGVYMILTWTLGIGLFMIFFGIGAFIAFASKELVYHPKFIDFNDEGVVIELPSGRKQIVKWEKITAITASYGDPDTLRGRLNRGGGLSVFNRVGGIALTYELAFVVRDEYFKRYGEQVNKVWRYFN